LAIYFAPFSAIAVSAAQDLWEVVAPADSFVVIRQVRFGQYSDAGDAAAELLGVTMARGYTVSGSGGSTITPINRSSITGALASGSTVERNNTTQANTTGGVVWAESWNVQASFLYLPDKDERLLIQPSERFVVSITAPADSITMNGTLVFEEIGRMA
jgi:hypothetical protein